MPTFASIGFNPTTKELSIKNNAGHMGESPFKLNDIGVKIKVTSSTTLEYETVPKNGNSAFVTEGLELKFNFPGKNKNAEMHFGVEENKFRLKWVGSDDIRVNHSDPQPEGILLMEEQIMSFELLNADKYLVIRYHKAM